MIDTSKVSTRARQAGDSDALQALARGGYLVSGVLHVLIGVIAVRVALGRSDDSADQSGALRQLAQAPGGQVMLWVTVVALAALGLWQLAEAAIGGFDPDGKKQAASKAKAAGKAVVYLVLAYTAFTYTRGQASGGQGSGGGGAGDVTAVLVQSAAGRVLLGLIGLGVLAVGAYHVYKGVTKKFLEDLRSTGGGQIGTAVTWLGAVGYVAKGAALGLVGVLFVVAAVQADPTEATGLDAALHTLRGQPFGAVLLILVGAGFVAYGLYSFARSRYARM